MSLILIFISEITEWNEIRWLLIPIFKNFLGKIAKFINKKYLFAKFWYAAEIVPIPVQCKT